MDVDGHVEDNVSGGDIALRHPAGPLVPPRAPRIHTCSEPARAKLFVGWRQALLSGGCTHLCGASQGNAPCRSGASASP